jgi:hypothetical protein
LPLIRLHWAIQNSIKREVSQLCWSIAIKLYNTKQLIIYNW